jgi:hypothetical protein
VGNRSIVAMRAAFVAVAASHALVTSAYNVATHTHYPGTGATEAKTRGNERT